MKVVTFPFHQPYQELMFKANVDWYVVDGYNNIWWDIQEDSNPDIACQNERELPDNITLITMSEFLIKIDSYDVCILPTADHVLWLYDTLNRHIRTILCHGNTEVLYPTFFKIIGEQSLLHTCSYTANLRPQDQFIKHGHDPNEFMWDGREKEGVVFPTNKFEMIGRYHQSPDRFGWDFRSVLSYLEVDVLGNNPQFRESYDRCYNLPYEEYREKLGGYEIGLQLGWQRGRTFTTSEMMLCEVPVIQRDEKTYFPPDMRTYIKDGINGYIARLEYGFISKTNKFLALPSNERRKIGENARQTIIKEQPLDLFISNWEAIIEGERI